MNLSSEKFATLSRRNFLKALGVLTASTISFKLPESAAAIPKDFSFVYLSDIHLASGLPDKSYLMLQESQLFLQDCIKGINALNPDFVIFGGDQVETIGANGANWQFFVDVVQGLSCPWYFVLGEEDVSGKPPPDKMREFGPDFKGRGIQGSESYWSLDPLDNLHLIGLDSSQPNSNTGDVSEEQLKWLKEDLASNKGKFTIVVSHHPLLPPHPYDGGPPWEEYIVPNGADVREVLGTSRDVRLVLSGHLYMNKVQMERDVYHVSCAGLSVYPCQYKHFQVSKDSITMQSYEVPLPKLVKRAMIALQESALASKINPRKPSEATENFEGADADQNCRMSLAPARTVEALSKKEIKEAQEKRNQELEKMQEEAANKGNKSKGKSKSKSKQDKSKQDNGDKESSESGKKESKSGSASSKKNKSGNSAGKKSGSKKETSKSTTDERSAAEDLTDRKPAEHSSGEQGASEQDPAEQSFSKEKLQNKESESGQLEDDSAALNSASDKSGKDSAGEK